MWGQGVFHVLEMEGLFQIALQCVVQPIRIFQALSHLLGVSLQALHFHLTLFGIIFLIL